MQRLTILGIIVCVGLLFAPTAILGAGPPGGLDVNVVNEPGVNVLNDRTNPVPVTGEVSATVTGDLDVNVVNEPGVNVLNDGTNPVPVTVQSNGLAVNVSTVYRFVGFSDVTTTGAAGGIGGMNSICQTDLEIPNARMCTTKEMLSSANFPTSTPGVVVAWVQPTPITSFVIGTTAKVVDASGYIVDFESPQNYSSRTNCVQWNMQYSDVAGMAFFKDPVFAEVGFGVYRCDRERPICCCAPAD